MNVEHIEAINLLLDKENPRLRSTIADNSQIELLRTLYSEMAVDEVALSIAANGFFPEEPLLVIEHKPTLGKSPTTYTVIEGNRRLAAVRLLTDDKMRKEINANDLPKITIEAKKKLHRLPCIVYPSRKALWQFLGFRHINGVKPWDSYSKANYVAEVHEKYGVSLDEIARKIGDKHSTVTRLYRGLTVLRQAEEQGFSKEDRARRRFSFSHIYTALDQKEFKEHLGIDEKRDLKKDPVPSGKKKELRELMTWLYGSSKANQAPVILSQNPDLNKLREVISQPAAISALRKGISLDRSHEISIGDTRRFSDALYGALEDLKQANGLFTTGFRLKDDGQRDAIDQIVLLGKQLKKQADAKQS